MKKLLTIVFSVAFPVAAFAQAPTPVPAPTPIQVLSVEQWGDKSMAEGKYEAAIQYYSRMILVPGVIEKIAKALAKMDKPPATPEQAEFHSTKGATFVKLAKTPTDFAKAVKEFQDAVNLAPWVFDYHFNLAVAYKSANQFKNALNSLALAKLLAANDEERRAVLTQRAEIEAAQEMATTANAEAEKAAQAEKVKANLPQALVQQLQSKYGNRRETSEQECMISGRTFVKCTESEANGATWTRGARDGSWSWMPMMRNGSIDWTSGNIRYVFHLDSGNPNRIVMGWAVDGSDLFCGLVKGTEVKDIEWKDCESGGGGTSVELRFGATPDGRPMFDVIKFCDASRNCHRRRSILE